MVTKKLKIAIYSGEVPSTTFIERLILGLALNNCDIFLFGVQHKRVAYTPNVTVATYTHNRFVKFFHLIKYGFLLTLFKSKDKRKLDGILKLQSKNLIYSKVKYYPVLWHKPDIFHLQWAKGLEDWAWVQEFGIKLVVSFLGTHINYSPITIPELGLMYQKYFPKVDGFHAVSKAIALKGEKYGASKNKIKVVYSGFNMDLFDFSYDKKTNKKYQIISVGRTHWVKGYSYALDACQILKEMNFQFEYTIIGGFGDIELNYQVHDLNLNDEVKLLDRLPFEDVKQCIHKADLLLLPSVEEGIANVVLEAMACKTLVLSTDCGGMNEVIEDGANGFLIPIRQSKLMADRIIEISNLDEKSVLKMIESAFDTVSRRHNEHQVVEGMMGLYRQL